VIGNELSPFFVPGEFAGTDDVLAGEPVTGIFEAAFAVGGDGIGMSGTRPVYFLPTSQVPVAWEGLQLTVAAGAFVVEGHEPDGTGVSMLLLAEA
jgi:hypothetical protein